MRRCVWMAVIALCAVGSISTGARHAAIFQRWRPDKKPSDCRYDQLEVTTPYELEKVFGVGRASR